jgi:FAD/FMN-containing dehydrogenase/Fe-S oxidoreductase
LNPISAPEVDQLAEELSRRVDGEVRFDRGSRAAYSTDGSNFRQVPIGVVIPRSIDAGVEAVAVCHENDVPVLSRGGGTSLAGQCTNVAVVIDWSKYCRRIVSVDVENRCCVVEPGIVLDELNRDLKLKGIRYGPEPATHPNCTLGGMIGNNSCGATAQRTGKVVDNVRRLEVLCYDGTRFWCGPTTDDEYRQILAAGGRRAEIYRTLRQIAGEYADDIRKRYPDIPRRVSGYNLDSLLPEKGFNVGAALVGSESTLVTVLHAELDLVPVVKKRTVVVLGYESVQKAADAVPGVVESGPIALEGLDHRLVHNQKIKHIHEKALEGLPPGNGWLMVQFGGDTQEEADGRARSMLDSIGRSLEHDDVRLLDDPEVEDRLWAVREAGLGATAHVPGHRDTWEGWEDSAVGPERLGDYLRDLEALYEEFGFADDSMPALYGHFGQGCVHTRIPFDLYSDTGVAIYKRFLDRAADLIVSYGGSLSGEHGDGQTRGTLLVKMFGPELVEAFGRVKALLDPEDRMNPGKVVHARPPDTNLRLGGEWKPIELGRLQFAFPEDGGSFVGAANRCVGVGKCRQTSNEGGAVMCPSYQVTLEEKHSTRGRSRLLFEMLNGHHDGPISDAWRSDEVHEALDLCLACKGCKTDCPVNVDMATYKSEFLSHYWKGRLRPRHLYALGWLPVAANLVTRLRVGDSANRIAHGPIRQRALAAAAGLENRPAPEFTNESLQQWWARRGPSRPSLGGNRGQVLLWPDTFTNNFHPRAGRAAVRLIEAAGWKVDIPTRPLCCGLTWISTGQLPTAKRILKHTASVLAEHVNRGGLVVGLEPSCTSVFRSDATELFPDSELFKRLKEQTVTLAELLVDHSDGYDPPRLDSPNSHALVQVHCHQHAILGWDADRTLLERAGVNAVTVDGGCCGLAGNFGFEPGHGEVSKKCAERVLLPKIREAPSSTVVLADGFSCRTQIHELGPSDREAIHLAELLASGLPRSA